jgi:UDP-2,3-diacylglucosamine pyrophosphatase LpxH
MSAAAADDFNYLVVSDLHLGEADRNPAGRFFHFDQDFADFLRHYRFEYMAERRWRLIIDGDFIEFFEMVDVPDHGDRLLRDVTLTAADRRFFPGTEWQKSVWKMDRALRSHPQLLLALARFLLGGNEIYILRGNHDVELFWPEVQEHFQLLLTQHHPADTTYADMKAAVRARLHFLPWFYLDKNLLYVEHGCQYDPFCTNEHNLCPVIPDRPHQIQLPFSAFTMRYFAARMAVIDPAAIENVNSVPRYLGRLIAKNPLHALRMPYYYAEMVVRTLRKVGRSNGDRDSEVTAREAAVRGQLLKIHDLPAETVGAIEALRETPILSSLSSTLKSFSLDLLAAAVAGTAAIWLLAPATIAGRSAAALISVLLIVGLTARWVKRASTINDHRNLRDIARSIAGLLGVRYVVFGHSHEPDAYRLSEEAPQWYFNVGTWVPNATEGHFVYLQVLRDHGDSAQLLRWNRRLQRPEPLDLARLARRRLSAAPGARPPRG